MEPPYPHEFPTVMICQIHISNTFFDTKTLVLITEHDKIEEVIKLSADYKIVRVNIKALYFKNKTHMIL